MKAFGTYILLNLKFRILVQRSCLSGLLRLICSQRKRLVNKHNRTRQTMTQRNKKEELTRKMLMAIKLYRLQLKLNEILVMTLLISTLQSMLWFVFVLRNPNLSLNSMTMATQSPLTTMKRI